MRNEQNYTQPGLNKAAAVAELIKWFECTIQVQRSAYPVPHS